MTPTDYAILVDDVDPVDEWPDGEGYEVVVLHETVERRNLARIPTDDELQAIADQYDTACLTAIWVAVYDVDNGDRLVKIIDPFGMGYYHLRDHLRDLKRATGRDNLFDKATRGWRKAIRAIRSPRKTAGKILARIGKWLEPNPPEQLAFWDNV